MTIPLHGTCDERFARLRRAIEANIASGVEVGTSFYIDIGGEPVVDLWGGWRDRERTVEWTADTLVNVWSSSKMITSLAVLMLADRGLVDLDAPVADYWPEFAANGKERIAVRHLLAHTSGVAGWERPFEPEEMYDHAASSAKLAAQAPWWEPGAASGYHANNFGHLNGEVVRRVTGKSLGRFIAEEITGPLGADYVLGLPDADVHRVAPIYGPLTTTLPSPPAAGDTEDWPIQRKTLDTCFTDPASGNDPDFRRAEIGATNGHGNARGIATALSAISLGGAVDGVRLLSPPTIDRIFEEQIDGTDLVLALPLRWGIGFALESAGVPYVRGARTCFWGGWGGSMGIMDTERGVTVGYVMCQMHPGTIGSEIASQYCEIVNEVIGVK